MVMAGGTGGHVMPALAVARTMMERGVEVRWIGSADGLESRLVPEAGIELDSIRIKGFRQSGLKRKLIMPLMLMQASIQAFGIIRKWQPDAMLGMGGFVSGPGGLAAGMLGKPLVLHEQNAVAGLTNRWLSRIAHRVLSGFPDSQGIKNVEWVGNPVRQEIAALAAPSERLANRRGGLRVLVVGGSQGAQVFNQHMPKLLSVEAFNESSPVEIWHQCGPGNQQTVHAAYREHRLQARVVEFIQEMSSAYRWCDLVICRAGAMTVSEVCAAGVAALFVPYPYAVSDHQACNAAYLADNDAAMMVRQSALINGNWIEQMSGLIADRNRLVEMATKARELARPDAANDVADVCEALIHA